MLENESKLINFRFAEQLTFALLETGMSAMSNFGIPSGLLLYMTDPLSLE